MPRIRVIPVLLVKGNGLYKTTRFKDPKYVGDPINAIKIFNDKEVDELMVLDITATTEKKEPNYKLISEFASECFMPVCYGGGIKTLDQAKKIFGMGIEKICLQSSAIETPELIGKIAEIYGRQAVVVAVDVKKNFFGKKTVHSHQGGKNTKLDPVTFCKNMEDAGAGEILLNSVDLDGTMQGYDLELIKQVSTSIGIPVVACGGAGKVEHLSDAVKKSGASAVSAGSMFVFHGPHRGVLINFPSQKELKEKLYA